MKAVIIVYNEAFTKEVENTLHDLNIRGFTRWQHVQGEGMTHGRPHLGTPAWPALNGVMLSIITDDARTDELLAALRRMKDTNPTESIHAFAWTVDQVV